MPMTDAPMIPVELPNGKVVNRPDPKPKPTDPYAEVDVEDWRILVTQTPKLEPIGDFEDWRRLPTSKDADEDLRAWALREIWVPTRRANGPRIVPIPMDADLGWLPTTDGKVREPIDLRWLRTHLPDRPVEVSDLGRVRDAETGEMLRVAFTPAKTRMFKRGWLQYAYIPSGGRKLMVHLLVALAFHGPPFRKDFVVEHRDGESLNRAADNLEWTTNRENRVRDHAERQCERHGRFGLRDRTQTTCTCFSKHGDWWGEDWFRAYLRGFHKGGRGVLKRKYRADQTLPLDGVDCEWP